MRLIKLSLIAMGLLILVGFVFVGYVSYQRMTGSGYFAKTHADDLVTEARNLSSPAPDTPVTLALGLSADAKVEAIHDVGNRILLVVRQSNMADRLYLLDPRTGVINATIALGQTVAVAPPPAVVSVTPTPPSPPPQPTAKGQPIPAPKPIH